MKEITVAARISGGFLSLAAYRKDRAGFGVLKESRSAARGLPEAAAPLLAFLELWAGKKFRFIFHLPRRMIVPRFLELPSLIMDEIRGMCAYRALAEIPFPEEDLVWDAVALDRDRSGGTSKVFMAIGRKSQLAPYFELFEKVGRFPDAFALSSFARFAYLREKGFKWDDYLHAHAEDGWLELDGFRSGKLASTRALPLLRAEDAAVRLRAECVRSVSAGDPKGGRLPHWVVSGESGFDSSGVLSNLEEVSEATVERVDGQPGRDWILSGCCQTPARFLLDLNTSAQKALQHQKSRRREIRLAALWGFLWIFSLGSVLGGSLVRKKIEISRLDSDIRKLEPAAQKTSEILERAAFLREQMDFSASPAEVLREIHSLAPAGMVLGSLSLDAEGRLVLQGVADRYSDVMDWVRALESSDLFSRAELKTSSSRKMGARDKVEFQIQCAVGAKA